MSNREKKQREWSMRQREQHADTLLVKKQNYFKAENVFT